MTDSTTASDNQNCPECGSPMGEITETSTGRKLKRCSAGQWDPQTKTNKGCPYIEWLPVEPVELDENCPKCGSKLILQVTRFGKKMKKCSTNKWDPETKKATGCDYVEWINGTTEPLDEECPQCKSKLVLFTTNKGKKLKKCSTAGWDKATRKATGCPYVQWLKAHEYNQYETDKSEELLPPTS